MFWNSMHDSEQFKVAKFALLNKFWSTLRYFNESIEYIWIRGQEKEMVVWIVRSQSNNSVNHQWIKKITYKKKEAPVMKVTMVMNYNI